MVTNRKFEKAAAYRSRVAVLVTLLVHLGLAAFLLLRSGDVKLQKVDQQQASTAASLRP